MGFSRRGYWSGLPFPSPGDLPDPGIEPRSLALQADSLLTELRGKPWWCVYIINVFFFSTSQWGVYIYVLSYIWFFVTPWTIVHQAPLSMGLSKQEYWMGYHFLLKGIFLIQGLNLHLLHLLRWQADSLPPCHLRAWKEGWAVLIYLISAKTSRYSSSPHLIEI